MKSLLLCISLFACISMTALLMNPTLSCADDITMDPTTDTYIVNGLMDTHGNNCSELIVDTPTMELHGLSGSGCAIWGYTYNVTPEVFRSWVSILQLAESRKKNVSIRYDPTGGLNQIWWMYSEK